MIDNKEILRYMYNHPKQITGVLKLPNNFTPLLTKCKHLSVEAEKSFLSNGPCLGNSLRESSKEETIFVYDLGC